MKSYLIIFTSLFILGCSNLTPESIKHTKSNRYFVINEKIEQTGVYGIGVTWVEGLMPGKYMSIGKDKKGEYFLGPNASFFKHVEGAEPIFHVGGVYVSNDGTNSLYFFSVGGTEQRLTATDSSLLVNNSLGHSHSNVVSGIGTGLGVGVANAIIASYNGKLVHDRKVHKVEIVNEVLSSLTSNSL